MQDPAFVGIGDEGGGDAGSVGDGGSREIAGEVVGIAGEGERHGGSNGGVDGDLVITDKTGGDRGTVAPGSQGIHLLTGRAGIGNAAGNTETVESAGCESGRAEGDLLTGDASGGGADTRPVGDCGSAAGTLDVVVGRKAGGGDSNIGWSTVDGVTSSKC